MTLCTHIDFSSTHTYERISKTIKAEIKFRKDQSQEKSKSLSCTSSSQLLISDFNFLIKKCLTSCNRNFVPSHATYCRKNHEHMKKVRNKFQLT